MAGHFAHPGRLCPGLGQRRQGQAFGALTCGLDPADRPEMPGPNGAIGPPKWPPLKPPPTNVGGRPWSRIGASEAPPSGALRPLGICRVAAPRPTHHIACVAAPCTCPPFVGAEMPTYSCANPEYQIQSSARYEKPPLIRALPDLLHAPKAGARPRATHTRPAATESAGSRLFRPAFPRCTSGSPNRRKPRRRGCLSAGAAFRSRRSSPPPGARLRR